MEICIRCHFITNSTATGCLMHIYTNTSSIPLHVLKATKPSNANTSEWKCRALGIESFDIEVYDIDRFENTSPNIALTMKVNINYQSLPVVIMYSSTNTISK